MMGSDAAAPEVRRCAGCGQAAAVCVADWQHTSMGMRSGASTRDFACQACGRRFTLVPKLRIWVWGVSAVLFVWTCVLGVVFGGIAAWQAWPWHANPVVPGAAMPALRFRADIPVRRCGSCGGTASCRQVTAKRSSGIPTGTDHAFECSGCGTRFTTTSVWGHVMLWLGAAVAVVVGVGCFPAGILLWLLGLGAGALSAWRLVSAVRNPLIAAPIER